MNKEFKVGDVVSFGGVEGVIEKIFDNDHYPIRVFFKDGGYARFNSDGYYLYWHKEPLLKFVSRPKKKVKKDIWINVFPNGKTASYESESDANALTSLSRIACVKTTIEYEAEG
jgi:hypothetical protein